MRINGRESKTLRFKAITAKRAIIILGMLILGGITMLIVPFRGCPKNALAVIQKHRPNDQPDVEFMITNRTQNVITYWAFTQWKVGTSWVTSARILHNKDEKRIGPKDYANCKINPPGEGQKWRLCVYYCIKTDSGMGKALREFLVKWNLNWLADRMPPDTELYFASGPEMDK